MGSFFLVFNAILNYDHLNAAAADSAVKAREASAAGDSEQ